jgi:hypothetical protein
MEGDKLKHFCLVLALLATFSVMGCSKPIHLGTLNESGKPNDFVAGLEKTRERGPQDIKTRQVTEAMSLNVGADSFIVNNRSGFWLDQFSFSCDVGHEQPIYFLWDAGWGGAGDQIDWLLPNTKGRALTQDKGEITLLHNDQNDNEKLGPNHVSWLLHQYHFRNCHVLDISDATEDNPIKRQTMIDDCHRESDDPWTQEACVEEGGKQAPRDPAKWYFTSYENGWFIFQHDHKVYKAECFQSFGVGRTKPDSTPDCTAIIDRLGVGPRDDREVRKQCCMDPNGIILGDLHAEW